MKTTSMVLSLALMYQVIFPSVASALTTGPSQPEVQSFEPVGTTDMVDMFSGDFVYNIPLLDVEGYPVNISYHGGVTMEQEASWVGLGFNINPGTLTRTVRGLPDDFNGETISKELNIKDETTIRVGMGVGGEIVGAGDPLLSLSSSLGGSVTFNNYRGVSVDFDLGCGIDLFKAVSAGVNVGVGSQTGASIDYNVNLRAQSSSIISSDQANGGISLGCGQGYNSRSGLKDFNFNIGISANTQYGNGSINSSVNVPIGVKNYVPVITNSNTMSTISGRIKVGLAGLWLLGYGTINGMYSTIHYNDDGSRKGYGYLYANNATTNDILDFTRDKDGMFNKTMEYLPSGNLTYDVYNATGQGTGGNFRPFRNDFGTVFDPLAYSAASSTSGGVETGFPWDFSLGFDGTQQDTKITSGPWMDHYRGFVGRQSGSLYEDVYFKQGGELTSVDPSYYSSIGGTSPVEDGSIPNVKPNSSSKRDVRANLLHYYTATEASTHGVGISDSIVNYLDTTGLKAAPSVQKISRIGSNDLQREPYQISEIVQTQTDGKRYIYGIPAMNSIQREATFSINAPTNSTDLAKGLVPYTKGTDDSKSNGNGLENYYSSTVTPSYAHSYLLSTVLSSDYVDITGDGPTDDDLGSYTKFNYSLKESDYRWRAPYDSGKAQYNAGYLSDTKDDKANYIIGSREQWMLHSIETKNFVAEFYVSKRNDALGCKDAIVTTGPYNLSPYNSSLSQAASSYKLDSIKLYNKHDRFINGTGATPIKTVFFVYDYSLCQGVPNFRSGAGTSGKLTLRKIYMKYGNSERSLLSPYQFDYSGFNPNYDLSCKDRWGNYKPNNSAFTNYEFPFVNQNDTANNTYASAWSLSNITLPSGGVIQASYESNNYGYVQNQPADEMFMVQGVGNSQNFNAGQALSNRWGPFLYAYFLRRTGSEISGIPFKNNYYNGSPILFNFNLNIHSNLYEQIKGYANIDDANIGICPNDSRYGYIMFKPISPTGSSSVLHPATYTAINVSRYNLPQIIYGERDPSSDFDKILSGLKGAFDDLLNIGENPVSELAGQGCGRDINLSKSYIRLLSPGQRKQGGGQRVKSLLFYDSWNALAGGNEQQATYGKNYDYTIKDDSYGSISSGVASYEPLIGGDENTMRQPIPYTAASGSNFPPNDPVELYQESPIGETLFPAPTVGYRKITVTSIHKSEGRSSQGIDEYQFYTAKDFPIKVSSTGLDKTEDEFDFDLFEQKNLFAGSEGYSLVFNDMHGKPKSVEHFVYHPQGGDTQMISSQVYTYNASGGSLNNTVDVLTYDQGSNKMLKQSQQLGVEADVTIDTREKDERTHNADANANLNVCTIPILFIPLTIPIPLGFGYDGWYENRFRSVVTTKIIQQYGILKQVQNFNEGTVTVMTNEIFDPITGQPIVTSVNNEYQDKEYNVNIPAYWGYRSMGPAYNNIGYEDDDTLKIVENNYGILKAPGKVENYNYGDELLVTYTYGGTTTSTTAWVMQSRFGDTELVTPWTLQGASHCCTPILLPRFPQNTTNWTNGNKMLAHVKVLRSGRYNRLNENIESYTTLDNPVDGSGHWKDTLKKLINLRATTFADTITRLLDHYVASDTINPFAIGEAGQYRVSKEWTYQKSRDYSTPSSRTAGLFSALNFWTMYPPPAPPLACGHIPPPWNASWQRDLLFNCNGISTNSYIFENSGRDPNWISSRTITKCSPSGKEVEDRDAIGVYSTAVYGYAEELPVAVASNARHAEILAEGFEDYTLLNTTNNLLRFNYSPFKSLYSLSQLGTSAYSLLGISSSPQLVRNIAHTGYYSLKVPSTANSTATSLGHSISGVWGINIPFVGENWGHLTVGPYYHENRPIYDRNEILPFSIFWNPAPAASRKYVISYWVKPVSGSGDPTAYSLSSFNGIAVSNAACTDHNFYQATSKSDIIDGWQQFEATVSIPAFSGGSPGAVLLLPLNYYVDDIRIYPADANMKSFVYNPGNEKLIATLDENNFATFYEYDQEGNLIRTKKETEKGVMTISESRSNNPKSNAKVIQ